MGSIGFVSLLLWALGGAVVLGGAVYAYMEYQASLLRTRVDAVPGGLRFTAHGFVVESRQSSKEIRVQTTRSAVHTHNPPGALEPEVKTGQLLVDLPAPGLAIEVSRVSIAGDEGDDAKPTGFSRIVLAAYAWPPKVTAKGGAETKEVPLHTVRLDQVPDPVAADFHQFANRLRVWIDKIEQQLAAQEAEKRQREEEEAAKARGLAQEPVKDDGLPITDAERDARVAKQVDKWRAAAGFKGTSTEVSYDARGKIEWFIDLEPTGKIILHAANRTFYGSLRGATAIGIGSELEISVRDDYWSEDDPRLVAFRVLGGTNAEIRRAWKERLDLLIQSLGGRPNQGP